MGHKHLQVYHHPCLLRVSGRDSERYLNGRLSAKIDGLPIWGVTLACALSAQGKVEFFGSIIREDKEQFLILGEGMSGEDAKAVIGHYIVADRVAIQDESSRFAVIHAVGDGIQKVLSEQCMCTLPQPGMATATSRGIITTRKRSPESGFDIVVSKDECATLVRALQEAGWEPCEPEDIRLEHFRGAVPSFPSEINDKILPLEVGLISAVAFNKGCYVGQEVIEKVDALGRLPRQLQLLRLPGELRVLSGAEVTSSKPGETLTPEGTQDALHHNHPVGVVVSAAYDPLSEQTLCFALIKTATPSDAPLFINRERATACVVSL